MKRFTDAGLQAIKNDNPYAALMIALTLPDICASLEGKKQDKQRYIDWCKQWLEPRYTNPHRHPITGASIVIFSAEECYKFRCSLLHAGSDEVNAKTLSSLAVYDAETGPHMNRFNDVVQINIAKFCEEMFDAVFEWEVSVSGNEEVQKNKEKLLAIRSKGSSFFNSAVVVG